MNKFDQNFDHNVHNTIRCRRACSSFHLNINLIGTLPYRVTSQRGYFHLHIYIYIYIHVCMYAFFFMKIWAGVVQKMARQGCGWPWRLLYRQSIIMVQYSRWLLKFWTSKFRRYIHVTVLCDHNIVFFIACIQVFPVFMLWLDRINFNLYVYIYILVYDSWLAYTLKVKV